MPSVSTKKLKLFSDKLDKWNIPKNIYRNNLLLKH